MKYNKLLFCIFILILMICTPANALTITHPEQNDMTVSENGIFFSGKIGKYEKIFINGTPIKPQKRGAFSYCFPLKEGENIFAIQKKDWLINTETIKYTITRVSPVTEKTHNQFIEQDKKYYKTIKDRVVLRSTPIDKGMNRLGYLPENTKVVIDGQTNEFSRVYLTKDNYAWVFTNDLTLSEEDNKEEIFSYKPQTILDTNQIKNKKETTTVIELSDNCPYSAVADDNKLIVTVYNLDTPDECYSKEYNLEKFPRYSVCMQNNILYITMKKNPISKSYSNRDVKIVIDAGHGGSENGAIGCLGDKEKFLNLDVALKLKKILEAHNFDVYLTRETDCFLSLNDRVKFAQDKDALIFISIHLNSVPISDDPNLNRGSIVFYFNPQSKNLAKSLSKTISQDLKTVDGGSSQASYAVIRPTEYIGALVELAYLVNPQDVAIYKNKKFAKTSAMAIYKGLANYIHTELEK